MMTSFSFAECVEMFLQIAELFGVILSLLREFNSRGSRVDADDILASLDPVWYFKSF